MTDDAQLEVVRLRTPFSIVPDDILTDARLSLSARAVLAFLVGRPHGFKIHIWYVRKEMGEENSNRKKTPLSPARWRRLRNEMERVGYFRQARERSPETGRWTWRHQIFDTAQTTIGTKSTDGESVDGRPIDGERANKTKESLSKEISTKRSSSTAAAAAPAVEPPPPPPRRAAPAAAAPFAQGKKWRRRSSGIVTWNADDEAEAGRLEETTQPETLATAITAIVGSGKDPLPGLVGKEIDRHARATKAQAAQAGRHEAIRASLPVDPTAAAVGESLLPATLRARAGLSG